MNTTYEELYDHLYRPATNDARFGPTQLAAILGMPVETPQERGMSSRAVMLAASKYGTRIGHARVNDGEGEILLPVVYSVAEDKWKKFMEELPKTTSKSPRKGNTRLGRIEAKLDLILELLTKGQ